MDKIRGKEPEWYQIVIRLFGQAEETTEKNKRMQGKGQPCVDKSKERDNEENNGKEKKVSWRDLTSILNSLNYFKYHLF